MYLLFFLNVSHMIKIIFFMHAVAQLCIMQLWKNIIKRPS